jgi:hypothetical protein
MKDRLFLLSPGFFEEQRGPLYCGDSLPIEGLLSLFPSLRESIDVRHVAFQKPREEIVAILGAEHQSAPVLVLGQDAQLVEGVAVKTIGKERYVDDEKEIRRYLSARFALPGAS